MAINTVISVRQSFNVPFREVQKTQLPSWLLRLHLFKYPSKKPIMDLSRWYSENIYSRIPEYVPRSVRAGSFTYGFIFIFFLSGSSTNRHSHSNALSPRWAHPRTFSAQYYISVQIIANCHFIQIICPILRPTSWSQSQCWWENVLYWRSTPSTLIPLLRSIKAGTTSLPFHIAIKGISQNFFLFFFYLY